MLSLYPPFLSSAWGGDSLCSLPVLSLTPQPAVPAGSALGARAPALALPPATTSLLPPGASRALPRAPASPARPSLSASVSCSPAPPHSPFLAQNPGHSVRGRRLRFLPIRQADARLRQVTKLLLPSRKASTWLTLAASPGLLGPDSGAAASRQRCLRLVSGPAPPLLVQPHGPTPGLQTPGSPPVHWPLLRPPVSARGTSILALVQTSSDL